MKDQYEYLIDGHLKALENLILSLAARPDSKFTVLDGLLWSLQQLGIQKLHIDARERGNVVSPERLIEWLRETAALTARKKTPIWSEF